MGSVRQVVLTSDSRICVLDQAQALSCHRVNFDGETPKGGVNIYDQVNLAHEITTVALGAIIKNNASSAGACWALASGTLQCAWVGDNLKTLPGNVAHSITGSSHFLFNGLAVVSPDKKTLHLFEKDNKLPSPIIGVDSLNLNQKYKDIAQAFFGVCTILSSTNEVSCQREKGGNPTQPKMTNEDLKGELVKKVVMGHLFSCALRLDDTAFCWIGENYGSEIPKNIKAE